MHDRSFNKLAAKDQQGKNKMSRSLEKQKSDYSKKKKILDQLEKQLNKIQEEYNDLKSQCSQARKSIMKLHRTLETMDLANASDAVFYDTGDVGYVIDGKEFHVSINEGGDIEAVPMRKFRSSKNKESDQEENAEDANKAKDQEVDELDKDVDSLYASLVA